MNGSTFRLEALVPAGHILLSASFGIALVLAMREGRNLTLVFERLIVGFLGIFFFSSILQGLNMLSIELVKFIEGLGLSV